MVCWTLYKDFWSQDESFSLDLTALFEYIFALMYLRILMTKMLQVFNQRFKESFFTTNSLKNIESLDFSHV